MNILFFCWEYPPQGSGIGRYVAEMSSALRANGHYTVVVTSRSPDTLERENLESGMIYRIFDRTELRSRKTAEQAVEIARRHDAAWIEGADHWGECEPLLRLRNRPPVVVKMHYNDVLLKSRYAQAWYPWQRLMIDLACLRQWRSIRAERYSLEQADVLLACCQRSLAEAQGQGIRLPRQTAVIPNPMRPLSAWKNKESGHPTLLLVGRLDVGKGLPYVRPLLENLLPAFPELTLEIAGGDSYARGLGSIRHWFLKQLGPVCGHVRLLGSLSREALDDAYRRAWVVIAPSRWDTFPQVVLESMARGKPIVASPHGGMPEMLDKIPHTIADPATPAFANMVRHLIGSPKERTALGKQTQARVHTLYSPTQVADQYIQALAAKLF
ncbi:MAG: glycosyltransferase family 4 protein [Kiritimatiellaeota bacterium]|nr:glycosyltransferase family 4 protein [Kiritimatiellota bacterium]